MRSVIAMHNAGGGVIVFGLDSSGNRTVGTLNAVREIDPIQISQKAEHYTGRSLPDVVREEFSKHGSTYPGWIVPPAVIPVPFSRAGDVHHGHGKPEKLFYPGQLYVRRGAASVPADAGDMALIVERIRSASRQEFAAQIGKFAVVPEGHTLHVLPPGAVVTTNNAVGLMRITTDPNAPAAVVVDKYITHPHRQTDLLNLLATRPFGVRANSHDILCIRKVYEKEIKDNDFVWTPPRAAPQYKEEFAHWIAGQIVHDSTFLETTRAAFKASAVS